MAHRLSLPVSILSERTFSSSGAVLFLCSVHLQQSSSLYFVVILCSAVLAQVRPSSCWIFLCVRSILVWLLSSFAQPEGRFASLKALLSHAILLRLLPLFFLSFFFLPLSLRSSLASRLLRVTRFPSCFRCASLLTQSSANITPSYCQRCGHHRWSVTSGHWFPLFLSGCHLSMLAVHNSYVDCVPVNVQSLLGCSFVGNSEGRLTLLLWSLRWSTKFTFESNVIPRYFLLTLISISCNIAQLDCGFRLVSTESDCRRLLCLYLLLQQSQWLAYQPSIRFASSAVEAFGMSSRWLLLLGSAVLFLWYVSLYPRQDMELKLYISLLRPYYNFFSSVRYFVLICTLPSARSGVLVERLWLTLH